MLRVPAKIFLPGSPIFVDSFIGIFKHVNSDFFLIFTGGTVKQESLVAGQPSTALTAVCVYTALASGTPSTDIL